MPRSAHSPFKGILFLLVYASAFAQPAELSKEIKLGHVVLIRDYLESNKAALESLLEAALEGEAALAKSKAGSATWKKVSDELESSVRRIRSLPEREQLDEITKMYLITGGHLATAVEEIGAWLRFVRLNQQAWKDAKEKQLAAARLLDYQTEIIGALSDHQVDTKFADLEPR